jgi:hypothetical protein
MVIRMDVSSTKVLHIPVDFNRSPNMIPAFNFSEMIALTSCNPASPNVKTIISKRYRRIMLKAQPIT